MTSDLRPGRGPLARLPGWVGRVLLVLGLLATSSCVYFNTYYNARKYFNQAERERQREEREAAERGTQTLQSPAGRSRQLYEKAARKASLVLEKFPESDLVDDAMFIMGRAFYWNGDHLTAEKSFSDLESSFADSPYLARARYWRALSLEGQGRGDDARRVYRALTSERDDAMAATAGLRLGEMASAAQDYVLAAQEYRGTLEAHPRFSLRAELWLRLGETLLDLQDTTRYPEAAESFARVLKAHPSTATEYRARLGSGRLLQARGDGDGALRVFTRLLEDGRFRAFEGQTRILVGRYHQERGETERALQEYARVRDDFPQSQSSAAALYNTGLLYLRDYGEEDRAREYLQDVARERADSEAARLAQQMLGYLQEIDQHRQRIRQADSLAAEQPSAAAAPADTVSRAVPAPDTIAAGNAAVVAGASALDASAQPGDSLRAPRAPAAAAAPARSRTTGGAGPARAVDVLAENLAVAEIYRDTARVAVPDSALHYYAECLRRFPNNEAAPRLLYSMGWVHLEMRHDREAARGLFGRLVAEYPQSVHANAARELLGLPVETSAEEHAAQEFARIEDVRLHNPADASAYVPLLDRLGREYPGTATAAQAAWVAAVTFQDAVGDTQEAETRFRQLLAAYPETQYGRLAAARDSVRTNGLLEKLERGLKGIGTQSRPGERIEVIALEPDSLDSVSLARKHLGLGVRAHRRGALKQAREEYELSLEQRRGQPDVLQRLGDVAWEQGFWQEAVEHYREALLLKPGTLDLQYRMLRALVADGKVDSANQYLRQIAQRDRTNPEVEYLLQEHPDLGDNSSPRGLERDELEALKLQPPRDELRVSFDALLAEMPVVRQAVLPAYPAEGVADSAVVLVDVLVDADGQVGKAQVFRGHEELRELALAAARQYRFYPAIRPDGEAQRVWVEIELPGRPRPAEGAVPAAAAPQTAVSPDSAGSRTP